MDWAGLLRLGLCRLGLAPDVFWRLTPVELMVMLGADAVPAPLTRARLDELARAYPDNEKGGRDGAGPG
ncbi:rcc01693 family protein [Tropicimonas isoalkanivorans]|uniref:rcc01693 family protein n=1 Tax=Tropicimonas isoalkanivorans TaxID=441112 RepID=UPI000B898B76|nr:rcc01693 family protein [Tropicimonas isoalkanivorans]